MGLAYLSREYAEFCSIGSKNPGLSQLTKNPPSVKTQGGFDSVQCYLFMKLIARKEFMPLMPPNGG